MRFRAYAIKKEIDGNYVNIGRLDGDYLRREFYKFGLEVDEGNIYKPMYVQRKYDLLLATLIQTYQPDLKTFSGEDYDEEVGIVESRVNDRVLFYIDLLENIVYIQNKKYQSSVLKHARTVERIENIVSKSLNDCDIHLMPAKIDYSILEIENLFKESNVRELHFTNLAGMEVPEDAEIHNPMREWDNTVAKSWNRYSKNDLNSIDLKAADGKTLTKNPIARLCMILAKQGNPNGKDIFKKMTINSNGEKEEIKLSGNENKVYNITKEKSEDSYEAYKCILKKNYPDYNSRADD